MQEVLRADFDETGIVEKNLIVGNKKLKEKLLVANQRFETSNNLCYINSLFIIFAYLL